MESEGQGIHFPPGILLPTAVPSVPVSSCSAPGRRQAVPEHTGMHLPATALDQERRVPSILPFTRGLGTSRVISLSLSLLSGNWVVRIKREDALEALCKL